MTALINGYKKSCTLAKKRIAELQTQRKLLESQGRNELIEELDLERRIRLLYTEYYQMQEIVSHLSAYMKAVCRK